MNSDIKIKCSGRFGKKNNFILHVDFLYSFFMLDAHTLIFKLLDRKNMYVYVIQIDIQAVIFYV